MLKDYERFAKRREEKRSARREEQKRVRRERNRARLERAGMPIPEELREPKAKMQRPGPDLEDKMLAPEDLGAEDKGASLEDVPLTAAGRSLAEEYSLRGDIFADYEPSGKTGFTKADVEKVISDYEIMGP